MSFEQKSQNKTCGGTLTKYAFKSESLGGLSTQINVFLPTAANERKVGVVYFLAGLTCTEDNAAQKAGFFHAAEKENLAMVFPDTSPRGAGCPGEDDSYDFGTGAGFYLDATKDPWKKHYNMYTYIVDELPRLLTQNNLPIDVGNASIMGHSMGGHGALVIYLRNLHKYKAVSAFSPICNPSACPWGEKAFTGYLQNGLSEGAQHYDATNLLSHLNTDANTKLNIKLDTGTADDFYKQKQLLPENLVKAITAQGFDKHPQNTIEHNFHEGYDHSYNFISTFAPYHIKWHAQFF